LRRITILIVSSPSLARAIEYLFLGRAEFEVVGAISGSRRLGRQAGQFLPDLIDVNVRPVSTGICEVVASLKQSSPLSKLILICPFDDLPGAARKCGADAYLNDEKLAGRLVRIARNLSVRPNCG